MSDIDAASSVEVDEKLRVAVAYRLGNKLVAHEQLRLISIALSRLKSTADLDEMCSGIAYDVGQSTMSKQGLSLTKTPPGAERR